MKQMDLPTSRQRITYWFNAGKLETSLVSKVESGEQ